MRVLQILNSPDPGGVLALANEIGSGLQQHGLKVETIFLASRPDPSTLTKLWGAIKASRQLVLGGYDAVIAYQSGASITVGVAGLLAPRTQRIVHQTVIPAATAATARFLDRIAGSIGLYPTNVVNTVFTRDQFSGYPKAYRRRLLLIEHGVPQPLLRQSRAATLKQHNIPDDGRIILNTARLVEQKNQEVIIRALASVPDARLVIAGEGGLRPVYEQLARSLGVGDRLHLLGALDHGDALQLYGAADLFVFPSIHETFGISAVEAVILGLPTVVSNTQVLREVLHIDGSSVVRFVPEDDVTAWTNAIQQFLDTPPQATLRADFGERLAAKYSSERMLRSYLDLIRRGK